MNDLEKYSLKKTKDGFKFEKEAVDVWYIVAVCLTLFLLYLFLDCEPLRVIIYDFIS